MQLAVLRIRCKVVFLALVPKKQREILLRTNDNAATVDLVPYTNERPLRRCDVDPFILKIDTGDLQNGVEICWIDKGVQSLGNRTERLYKPASLFFQTPFYSLIEC